MTNRFRLPPSEEPDPTQQDDALRKGQGMAMFWAERGRLTDEAALLGACLHDRRYDSQIDDTRGEWLWRIIEAAGAKERLRSLLLDSLHGGIAEEDAHQGCQLALCYSLDGDLRFANAIRNLVAGQRFPRCPWIGEEELLRLDGEAGLVLAARVRGAALDEPTGWFDSELIREAVEQLGETRVRDVLAGAAETDLDVRRFYDAWRDDERSRSQPGDPRQTHEERMKAISVEEVTAAAESGERKAWLRGWGMYATKADLRSILSRIWTCREPKVLATYLWVFSNRVLPEFDERLVPFLDHPDARVRQRAVTAISKNSDAAIRAYIERTNADHLTGEHIELFRRNFRPGDEEIIARLIPSSEEHRIHAAFLDITKVLEQNPEADCSWLAYLAYESTPCGNCRYHAAKLLIERRCAPEWLVEECRRDSEGDTRILAGAADDTLPRSNVTP